MGVQRFYASEDGHYIFTDRTFSKKVTKHELVDAFRNNGSYLWLADVGYGCTVLQFEYSDFVDYAVAYVMVRTSTGTEIRPYYSAEYNSAPA